MATTASRIVCGIWVRDRITRSTPAWSSVMRLPSDAYRNEVWASGIDRLAVVGQPWEAAAR